MSKSLNHISIKRVLRIMAVMALLILLMGIVTPSFCIQPVKAQGVSYTVASTGAVPDSTGYNNQRKLAITSDGHIHAVYHRLDSNGILQIYHAKSSDEGKTWIEEPVTSGSYNQTYPAIAADSQNNLHIIWQGYTSTSPDITQIRYRKWTTSGWGGILDLTHDTGWHQNYPAIAIDSHDYLHVAWHKTEFTEGYWCSRGSKPDGCGPIYYMKNTGSWSEPIRIGISDQNNEINPSISIDSNDYINVAWNEGGYQNADCWHSAFTYYTTSWQPIESFECLATWPSITVDSKEKVHLALIFDYPIHDVIYRSRTASGWGSPETVYSSSFYAIIPSIAADSNDYLHVVWPEDGNVKYRQYTSSWQNTETIISDTTSSWPNLLWAWNPQVNGKRPNILQNGFVFLYTSGQEIKFYSELGETIPQPKPTVTEITPNSGVNNEIIQVTISGSGFMEGATVKLTKIGTLGKIGLYPIVDSPNTIRCSFGLDAATLGSYDVVVTNPDGQFGTLANGFNVMPVEVELPCDFSNQNGIERCFGGIGRGCNGVPVVASFTKDPETCKVQGWMSVGSILHDKCCIATDNTGVMCAHWDGSNTCQDEWDEAMENTVCTMTGAPRQWSVTFGPYPFGNTGDFGDVPQASLKAPVGTRVNLDNVGYCISGKCKTDGTGNTIIKKDVCEDYCECQNVIIDNAFTIYVGCPVDISITDPDGLKINKHINEIYGATYTEFGIGSDGTPDAKIEIPERKIGFYQITLTPKSGASPDATFTLQVQSDGNTRAIADNVMIKNIPNEPYRLQVTEEGKIIIIGGQIPTPEFPSLVLPATMIIGFMVAVLLIQRTREH